MKASPRLHDRFLDPAAARQPDGAEAVARVSEAWESGRELGAGADDCVRPWRIACEEQQCCHEARKCWTRSVLRHE